MEVYREVQRISIPPAVATRRLVESLGETATGSDSDRGQGPGGAGSRWTYSRLGGLYSYEVCLDPGAGEITTVVSLPNWTRLLAWSALIVVPLLVLLSAPPIVLLAGTWAYAVVALLPAMHLWPGVGLRPDLGRQARTVSRRTTAVGVPAYAGSIGCIWAAFRPGYPTAVIDLLTALLLAVGVGIFYAGNAFREADSPSITAIGIPLSGLLPALFATGNFVLAAVLLEGGSAGVPAVAAVLVVALGFDAAFVVYCRAVLDSFRDARLESLRSPLARVAGLGMYATVNAVLLVALGVTTLALATWTMPSVVSPVELPLLGVTPLEGRLRAVFTPFPGPTWAYATGFATVLVLPVLATAVMWAVDLVTGVTARHALLSAAEPLDVSIPTAPAVGVQVVDHERPFVRPVSVAFGARQYVLVSRPVLELLAEDERDAVLAHEAYHLENRDLTVRAAATFGAIAFGGRNSLLAFYDLAGAERRADEFAADHVGTGPLIRALRRLQDCRAGADPASVLAEHTTSPGATTTVIRGTLRAPYELFFGSVLFEQAHRPVDERVSHLLARRGDDPPATPQSRSATEASAEH